MKINRGGSTPPKLVKFICKNDLRVASKYAQNRNHRLERENIQDQNNHKILSPPFTKYGSLNDRYFFKIVHFRIIQL